MRGQTQELTADYTDRAEGFACGTPAATVPDFVVS